jgi:hypothetical protein
MTRRLLPILLAGTAVLASLSWAADDPAPDPNDPPPRLEKKNKPRAKVEQPKDPGAEEKKPEAEPKEAKEPEPPPDAGEDEKEVLQRVFRNMRAVEERLANKELNDGTRQTQEDILKDLDALIRMAENPPPGGGGGEDKDNQDKKDNQGAQAQAGGSRSKPSGTLMGQRNQQARGRGRGSQNQMAGGKPGTGSGQQQQNPNDLANGSGNAGGGGGQDRPGEMNRNADLFKDVWGNLPETLRAELNAYARTDQYMAKYDELIKKYYRTIAEQGRRKGE